MKLHEALSDGPVSPCPNCEKLMAERDMLRAVLSELLQSIDYGWVNGFEAERHYGAVEAAITVLKYNQ